MGSTVALQTLICMLQRLPYYLALHEGGPQPYMAGAPDQGERFGNPGITFPNQGDHIPNRTPLGDNPSWSGTGGVTPGFKAKPDAHRMYAQDQVVIHTVRM
jgi:hypothetical protein